MTGKTFATMQTNVGNMLHDTTATMKALIKVWINDAYRDAWRREFWSDLIDDDFTFESVVDQSEYIFGEVKTVTVGASGTGYSVDDVLTIIQTGGSGATVKVLTVDTGGEVLTVSLLTGGKMYSSESGLVTTGGDGEDCTINITLTDLPITDFGKELIVADIANGHLLTRFKEKGWWERRAKDYNADSIDSGNSIRYVILNEAKSIKLDPPPDTAETYAMPYQKEITDMSSDSDVPAITTISTYLEFYAMGMGSAYKKEFDASAFWHNKAEAELQKCVREEKVKLSQIYQRVLAGYTVNRTMNLLGDKSYDTV